MASTSASDNEKSPSTCHLVFDGACRLCVATKHRLEQAGVGHRGLDVRFVPYQSAEARRLLGHQYRPGRPDMAFLVEPSGNIRQGLDAFLPFVSRLPAGRLALWLLKMPLLKGVAESLYRIIARNRYRWFGEARSS